MVLVNICYMQIFLICQEVILRQNRQFRSSNLVNLFPLSTFDPTLISVPCLSSLHCSLSLSLAFPERCFLRSFSKSFLLPNTTGLSVGYCLALSIRRVRNSEKLEISLGKRLGRERAYNTPKPCQERIIIKNIRAGSSAGRATDS